MLTTNMFFYGSPANTTGSWSASGSYVTTCTVSPYTLYNFVWSGGGTNGTILPGYSFFTATRIA